MARIQTFVKKHLQVLWVMILGAEKSCEHLVFAGLGKSAKLISVKQIEISILQGLTPTCCVGMTFIVVYF